MMWIHKWATCIAVVMVMVSSGASRAEAQVVSFTSITDAVATRFFNPATSRPAVGNANKLVIGLHNTFDSTALKWTNFRASTAAFSYTTAADTISFTIKAPTGFYVAKITYAQTGSGSVVRTGKVAGAATWVVAGRAMNLGTFSTNGALSRTVDISAKKLTSVPVSITDTLFAFATPSLGSATLTLTGANVSVYPLPK
jgi:hypothetical protein